MNNIKITRKLILIFGALLSLNAFADTTLNFVRPHTQFRGAVSSLELKVGEQTCSLEFPSIRASTAKCQLVVPSGNVEMTLTQGNDTYTLTGIVQNNKTYTFFVVAPYSEAYQILQLQELAIGNAKETTTDSERMNTLMLAKVK